MKTRVLDSWPVLEWIFGKDPAATQVARTLAAAEAGRIALTMSAINAGEVFYFLRKQGAAQLAARWRNACATLPVTIDVPPAAAIWAAAEIKGSFPLSYADAFAAELAMRRGCRLMTGDPGFKAVAGLHLDWIG